MSKLMMIIIMIHSDIIRTCILNVTVAMVSEAISGKV